MLFKIFDLFRILKLNLFVSFLTLKRDFNLNIFFVLGQKYRVIRSTNA